MKLTALFRVLGLVASLPAVFSISDDPYSFQEKQPDGTDTPVLNIHINAKFHYMTDSQGYTVIQDLQNWYVYAKLDEETGELKSSGFRVGKENPDRRGLEKGIVPVLERIPEEDENDTDLSEQTEQHRHLALSVGQFPTGHVKHLVILARFSDHQDRKLPPPSDYEILMNKVGGDPNIAPTGSVHDFMNQISYGKLNLESVVYPKWIDLPHTETYYGADNLGRGRLFKEAVKFLLEQLDNDPNFHFSDVDGDGDGRIDSFTILHSGVEAAMWRKDCWGTPPSKRILGSFHGIPKWYAKDGTMALMVDKTSGVSGICASNINRINIIVHELGHYFGFRGELYDGRGSWPSGRGVGYYDMMSTAFGFGDVPIEDKMHPPLMSAWSKIKTGLMTDATELTQSGFYHLDASAIAPEAYKINVGFPEDEYLLIENRQKISFDALMPHGGLAIWHVDEKSEGSLRDVNTKNGFPGQDGWPSNGNHYTLALLQADGQYDLERSRNRGDDGDFFYKGGVSSIGPSTSPMEGPFPNTDSYQGGNISPTGIKIFDISESANTMSFRLHIPGEAQKELMTTFQWNKWYTGSMFDIEARTDIDVTGFDIHVRKNDYAYFVEVWTKEGTSVGFETNQDAWTKIGEGHVTGKGTWKRTPLPEHFFDPVRIHQGDRKAFYITLTNPDGLTENDMHYSSADTVGDVFINSDLIVEGGIGLGYPFVDPWKERIWNGVVKYQKYHVSNPLGLSTVFSGDRNIAGEMFVVRATKDILIKGFDINVGTTEMVTVEIYTKAGNAGCCHNSPNKWSKVAEVSVKGRGQGNKTPLPRVFTPIEIQSGGTQAFYITSTNGNQIVSSRGGRNGRVFKKNSDLTILEGFAKNYPFSRTNGITKWNGVLYYSTSLNHKELSTTFGGNEKTHGSMFDVVALHDIIVRTFDIHVAATDMVDVEVYTKAGTAEQHHTAKHAWKMIGKFDVQGSGFGSKTTIPEGLIEQVDIPKGSRQSFYITLKVPEMVSTVGTEFGNPFSYNHDLRILEGYSKKYPFSDMHGPRVWNGAVHYVYKE